MKVGPHFKTHLCCFVILQNTFAPNHLKLLTTFRNKAAHLQTVYDIVDLNSPDYFPF